MTIFWPIQHFLIAIFITKAVFSLILALASLKVQYDINSMPMLYWISLLTALILSAVILVYLWKGNRNRLFNKNIT